MTPNANTFAGKYVFVSGFAGGREVFLGRAIDEPFSDMIQLEGKPIALTQQGFMVIRPFTTIMSFPMKDPNFQVQFLTNQGAIDEVTNIFKSSISTLNRMSFPLTHRWIESAVLSDNYNGGQFASYLQGSSGMMNGNGLTLNNPFNAFYKGFANSAEQFRRALFTSPQVNTTKEMDKITELDGDLTIEIGKVTNEIAVKFNHMISREAELTHYF